MNRILVILLLNCFYSNQLFSKEKDKTVVVLESINKKGDFKSLDSMVIEDSIVSINGEKLLNTQVIGLIESIKFLTLIQESKLQRCIKGTYKHIVKVKNEEKLEKGCLESRRYSDLKMEFQKLSKLIVLDQ